jgi:hypothetical protein
MKTIQVTLKQYGKTRDYTFPQLRFEMNFTKENQQLDKIYAVNLLPWDDDSDVELDIWKYEDSSPILKFTAYLKPEKVHGIFQVYSIIGGNGVTREALHVTDSHSEALKKFENIIKWKVRDLLDADAAADI